MQRLYDVPISFHALLPVTLPAREIMWVLLLTFLCVVHVCLMC